jgi:hypothetical protein
MPKTQEEPVELELSFEPEPLLERYSARHEFPISLFGAAFLMLAAFGVVYLAMSLLNHSATDKRPVPITMMEPSGEDNTGEGSPGGQGVKEPEEIKLQQPTPEDYAQLPQKAPLPDVKADIAKDIPIDPNGTVYIPEEKAAAYGTLSDDIRRKLTSGNKGNNGNDPGPGPGGTGAHSTKARSIRWVLRFKTDTGRDYVNQLSAMGAIVFIPLKADDKKGYLFRDLKSGKPGELIDANGLSNVADLIQFCDFKRTSVREVASALNLNFDPDSFWAFFPRTLENDLARKEEAFLGRKAEEIAETTFQVVVREGRADIVVVGQKARK